ncbi:MAG: hypothetical protein AKCLJLPJ_01850 [Fimbriimonadales bacterium]|nr:hypothetical protein [Fimbriimonadales bacterium]
MKVTPGAPDIGAILSDPPYLPLRSQGENPGFRISTRVPRVSEARSCPPRVPRVSEARPCQASPNPHGLSIPRPPHRGNPVDFPRLPVLIRCVPNIPKRIPDVCP